MKIVACYISVTNGPKTPGFALRFTETWRKHSPGAGCDLFAICNGGPPAPEVGQWFKDIGAKVWPRQNDPGWDISAFIHAASCFVETHDAILCLGESVYFHREGWLKRLVEAWEKHGAGIYGPFASNVIRGHLQTSAFICPTRLLYKYPHVVKDKKTRYAFEHGLQSIWRYAVTIGYKAMLVTWDGEYMPTQWRTPRNILWSGDQSNCLMWNNHTDNYRNAEPERKRKWELSASREFA